MLHPDDLSRLINGNDTPNAVESASIRRDLGNLKVQIASLEIQLNSLRGQERARQAILSPLPLYSTTLVATRWSTSPWYDAYEAVLHIPPEVLQRLKSLALFCDWHGMHIFDMLQHCTDLETLQLDTDSVIPWEGLEAAEELMENRLKVPKLRTLRFRRAAGIDFLDCVRTPALRHLDLGCTTAEAEGDLDEEFAETLENFILQSRLEKKLKTLRIYDIYIDAEELGQTLAHLRNLRELTLDRVRMDSPWSFWMQFWDNKSAPGADEGACLPFLGQMNLLHPPSKYPFIHIADFFAENQNRVHCQMNVSYEEGGQYMDNDFKDLPLKRAPVSFRLIPLVPLDESYFSPTGERDFVCVTVSS